MRLSKAKLFTSSTSGMLSIAFGCTPIQKTVDLRYFYKCRVIHMPEGS